MTDRDRELDALREQLHDAHAMVQAIKETPWVWAGDGTDDLHGMSYDAGITILAGQLRTLLAVVEGAASATKVMT